MTGIIVIELLMPRIHRELKIGYLICGISVLKETGFGITLGNKLLPVFNSNSNYKPGLVGGWIGAKSEFNR